jgi:glycosyltransferase involved in cell wall biosynthesis
VTPISPGYIPTIKSFGVDEKRITVVKGGVDLIIFRPKNNREARMTFLVLYSGAFSIAYDFDQIFQAAQVLESIDPTIRFIIQGKGELALVMIAKVSKLSLKNLKIINELFPREEVSQILNSADALILPLKDFGSPYLGLSTKLYEYQAIGKPIICCADGQPAEYVKSTTSGLVVKPGDYLALVNAILFLKNNTDFSLKMGENGRKYVVDNLSIEKIGMQMKKLFCANVSS